MSSGVDLYQQTCVSGGLYSQPHDNEDRSINELLVSGTVSCIVPIEDNMDI